MMTAAIALLGPAGNATAQSLGIPPQGANDFSCRPTAIHPSPVIILHGTFGDMTVTFVEGAPLLAELGHCVFALDYGDRATGPIDASAEEIADFTRRVMRETGARTVSYVGHSQGGMIGRYVARFEGLGDRVEDIVGVAPSNHGTKTPLAPLVGALCPACADQVAGSELLQRLNAGDETPPPASYTNVVTRYDGVVTPYTSGELAGGRREVTNVTLQDACPRNGSEHVLVGVPGDPVAVQWIVNALARPGPANPAFEPDCSGATLGLDPDPFARLVGNRLVARADAVRVPVRCFGPQATTCRVGVTVRHRGRKLGTDAGALAAGERERIRVELAAPLAGSGAPRHAEAKLTAPSTRASKRRYRVTVAG